MDTVHEKLEHLKKRLRSLESLAVAFSGGVDSTFLVKVAHDVLGNHVLAVTARSSTYPEREFREAIKFITDNKIPHETIISEELDIEGFSDNPPNRCYFCKRELFSKIVEAARQRSIRQIADGSNLDDLGDYRPGMQAIQELGVISPLKEAKLTKQDIRDLSREMNLPTWDKPALACLASRLPYGHKITRDKLATIDQAEQLLRAHGFKQVRVRHHGDMARIEVAPEERARFFDACLMDRIYEEFKQLGFAYTALDLKGYRTGSMNETIL
jgi:pyridinium-3,5-biscarboxylic acid mononucleotide sulfurtransferase